MKFKQINNIVSIHKKLRNTLQLFKSGNNSKSYLCKHGSRKNRCTKCNRIECKHGELEYKCIECICIEALSELSSDRRK